MEELFQDLEQRIKWFIQQHRNLELSHLELHQGKANLIREKEVLSTKHQKAILQIETLVTRLKSIETLS